VAPRPRDSDPIRSPQSSSALSGNLGREMKPVGNSTPSLPPNRLWRCLFPRSVPPLRAPTRKATATMDSGGASVFRATRLSSPSDHAK